MRSHFSPFRALALALFAMLAAPVQAASCPYTFLCVGDTTNAQLPGAAPATQALGAQSIALGGQANTNGSIAIGGYAGYNGGFDPATNNANAYAVAIGRNSFAASLESLAVGASSQAMAAEDTAIGAHAAANPSNKGGQGATAVGAFSNADNARATAVGYYAHASAISSFAAGDAASASGTRSIAILGTASQIGGIGIGGVSTGAYSGAWGTGATATADNSDAIGSSSLADQANTVSFGNGPAGVYRRLVNVAPGTSPTDVATIAQIAPLASSLGGGANYTNGVYTAPSYTLKSGTYNDVGSALTAIDNEAASGGVAWIASTETTAANAQGYESTSLGAGSQAGNADTGFNVAVGANALAGTIGSATDGSGGQATAVGAESSATNVGSTALGHAAQAKADFSVAIGDGAVADEYNTVSFGVAGLARRRLVNIADGINANDAVSVEQLYPFATAFGGGSNFTGGFFTAPTYVLTAPVAAGTYNDVGTALSALDNGLTAVNQRVDNIGTGGGGVGPAGPQGPKGDTGAKGDKGDTGAQGADGTGNGTDALAVHYDDATGSDATLTGANGTRIHNMHDGVADTDGANVGQVNQALNTAKDYADAGDAKTLDWAKAYTDQRLAGMNKNIARAGAVGSVMGTMALSAGAIPQQDKLSMGVAGYRGQSAVGIAYTHRFNNNRVAVAVGGAFTGGGSALGVSVSIGLGD